MKSILLICAVLVSMGIQPSFCAEEAKPPLELKTETEKISYTLGIGLGKNLKEISEHIDLAVFIRALEDGVQGKESLLTEDEMNELQQVLQQKITESREKKNAEDAAKNKAAAEVFFKENGAKQGVVTTKSGLQYEVLVQGEGEIPSATDAVKVHFVMTNLDGSMIQDTVSKGEPFTYPLNRFFEGWQEALLMMKVGSKYKLYIPSELALGEAGNPPQIGPNSAIVMELELVGIEGKGPQEPLVPQPDQQPNAQPNTEPEVKPEAGAK